jgi:hypothetical protein
VAVTVEVLTTLAGLTVLGLVASETEAEAEVGVLQETRKLRKTNGNSICLQ